MSPRKAAAVTDTAEASPNGAAGFRVQPTGRPRLLEGPPPAAPQPSASTSSDTPAAGEILEDGQELVERWEPDQAAAAVVGVHNILGGAVMLRDSELMDAWHAEAAELRAAAPALGRLLDRIAPPAAGGPIGLGLDLAAGLGAVLSMEVRHGRAVGEIHRRREQQKKQAQYKPSQGGAQPARSAPAAAEPGAPSPRPPAPAPPPPSSSSGDDFAYPPDLVAMLGGLDSGQPGINDPEERPWSA